MEELNSDWNGVPIAIETVLIPLITVGNIVVIVTIVTHQHLRKASDILVINLATADLCIGLMALPFDMYVIIAQKYFNALLPCFLKEFFWIFSLTSSVQCLFFISLETYCAIIYPLKHFKFITTRKAVCAGIFSWSIALFFSVGALIARNEWEYHASICSFTPTTILIVIHSLYITALILSSAFMYCRVFAARVKPTVFPFDIVAMRSRQTHIKKAKTMAIVFFNFLIFWSPAMSYLLYLTVNKHTASSVGAFKLFTLLASSNSVNNWIVYMCKREEFRKIILKFCKRKIRNQNDGLRVARNGKIFTVNNSKSRNPTTQ
ncbi:hypothetical protein SNE40_017308 [Patella caerulea]|uniref:G-protein coupled receptors family 1 profile domain-containing protein n=1 Tax=Patella caerulea TaxID=87958 RepID=A0AAN8JA66_PATCE